METRSRAALLEGLFRTVVRRPWWVICLCLLICGLAAWQLPDLEKDLRSDAFLAADNPALVYRDIVKEKFGLSDPLVLAIVDERPGGIYKAEVLSFLQRLTDDVSGLRNINSSRVLSLATEKNIASDSEGIVIEPFLTKTPASAEDIAKLRGELEQFPLYLGSLVSEDGHAALIIAELQDEDQAESSYHEIMGLVQAASIPTGVVVHVAGEGAVMGYLVSYVDADARRLVPFAGIAIILVILFAYRQLTPALMCCLLMLATLVITLGFMASQGVPLYVISTALPVVLVGISVADAIHIYSHYFHLQATQPASDRGMLVVETMLAMWRPVTLTTLTTMAGFLGLYFAGYMPPFEYFGFYAAFGVGVAWALSLTFLPAVIGITLPASRPVRTGGFTAMMSALGSITLTYSRSIIALFIAMALIGIYAAAHLKVDDDPIGLFLPDEPLVVADRAINRYTRGSNTLDIVVETSTPEGLFDSARLRKMEAMQEFIATLPYVGGSVSIVDYLKQMNRALNDGDPAAYQLPDDADLVAQYFLIYSAMSDPTDFEEEVDYDYRTANIRVNTTSGGYQDALQIIEPLERYIAEEFNDADLRATLSGRVNLNYRWIKELSASHFAGLAIALVLVWGVSALLFRSEVAGVYTLVPVAGTVLGVYAVMVALGITLGMGTSMFAAIAIGLGIDFAIHTLDRLRSLSSGSRGDMAAVFHQFYPTTGKALLFNFLAIACGFGVLTVSKIVSLNSFGSIVVLAISTSFIASMTLLPALVLRTRPRFVVAPPGESRWASYRVALSVTLVFIIAATLVSPALQAQELVQEPEPVSAEQIVNQVNAVDDGEFVTRIITMTLVDRRGQERVRETVSYRKYYGEEMRTVLFYLSPANVRDTAFLIWDYPERDKEDDQWLYLPALRKVRRISAADRGDYFLGTDFTYEDIKLDGKLEPVDYDFSLLGKIEQGNGLHYQLQGIPKTEAIASELGYSRMDVLIDADNWMLVEAKFWDLKGNLLKTLAVSGIVQIDDIWSRTNLTVDNHQTGHQTHFVFTDVDYVTPVDDSFFSKQALERGH
jgi:uncharacterized protein